MKQIKFTKMLFPVMIIALFFFCTASTCSDSGSSTSGGNDGPDPIVGYNATYEFNSVNLLYDFSYLDNSFNFMNYDAAELYRAHDVDPTKFDGSITNLRNIVFYEDNYDWEHKPSITIQFFPQGGNPLRHGCSLNDVGDKYIMNCPDFGANLNSFIVTIKSIKTQEHGLQLFWSKTFDLNNSWWETYIGDHNLNGNADITVTSYTKSDLREGHILLRREGDAYELLACAADVELNDGIIECDVEIVFHEEFIEPTLDRDIIVDGEPVDDIVWDAPKIGRKL